MEKIYSLLWIVFAIGVFVFRMVKKMQDTTARESQERPNPTASAAPGLPQVTFQELLRQMQSRNASEPVPAPAQPAPKPPKAAKPGKKTPGGRPVPLEVARPALSQERTQVRSKSLEERAPAPAFAAALPRASTEAPMEDYWQQRTRERAEDAAAQAPTVNQTVRQLLAQPQSVRAAFVISEILQRRHF